MPKKTVTTVETYRWDAKTKSWAKHEKTVTTVEETNGQIAYPVFPAYPARPWSPSYPYVTWTTQTSAGSIQSEVASQVQTIGRRVARSR